MLCFWISVLCLSWLCYMTYASLQAKRPDGKNKFLNLNSITVTAKTESRSNYTALHLAVSGGLKLLQACVLGSNPQTSMGENLAGESKWVMLSPPSLTIVKLPLSKALNPQFLWCSCWVSNNLHLLILYANIICHSRIKVTLSTSDADFSF